LRRYYEGEFGPNEQQQARILEAAALTAYRTQDGIPLILTLVSSVIPMSLMNDEGVALLIQYNPYGVFLMLEELGSLLMSLSFLFMAPVFGDAGRLPTAIRWVFGVSGIAPFALLLAISSLYGMARLDRFEVVVISISWLTLSASGILLSVQFRRHLTVDAYADHPFRNARTASSLGRNVSVKRAMRMAVTTNTPNLPPAGVPASGLYKAANSV